MYPDNFISLDELRDDYPTLTPADWKKLAEGINIPISRARIAQRGSSIRKTVLGLKFEEVAQIEKAYEAPKADESIISANKLAIELSAGVDALLRVARENEIVGFVYNFGKGPNGIGFNEYQASEIRSIFALRAKKIPDGGVKSVASLRRELRMGPEKLSVLFEELDIVAQEYFFGRVYGFGVTAEDLEKLYKHLGEAEIKPAGPDVISFNKLAVEIGTSKKVLMQLVQGVGIEPKKYLFHGIEGYGLTSDEVERLTNAYSEFNRKDKQPISAKSFSREHRIQPDDLTAIAQSVGVEAKRYRFGKRYGLGYTPDEIERMKQAYAGYEQVEIADQTVISLVRLAKHHHMAFETLKKLFDEAGIEVSTFRFGNGKQGVGVRRPQIEALHRAYEPFTRS